MWKRPLMNKLEYFQVLWVILLVLEGGCATFAPASKTEKVIERDGVSALLIPSEYRDVYFIPKGSRERHCRAPGPDFSVEASDGVNLGLGSPVPGMGKGSVGFDSGQAALSLGGRSADVLLTRELMYRACELTANLNSNNKESKEIYYRFLKTIERLGKTQIENGVISATDKIAAIPSTINQVKNSASTPPSDGSPSDGPPSDGPPSDGPPN